MLLFSLTSIVIWFYKGGYRGNGGNSLPEKLEAEINLLSSYFPKKHEADVNDQPHVLPVAMIATNCYNT